MPVLRRRCRFHRRCRCRCRYRCHRQRHPPIYLSISLSIALSLTFNFTYTLMLCAPPHIYMRTRALWFRVIFFLLPFFFVFYSLFVCSVAFTSWKILSNHHFKYTKRSIYCPISAATVVATTTKANCVFRTAFLNIHTPIPNRKKKKNEKENNNEPYSGLTAWEKAHSYIRLLNCEKIMAGVSKRRWIFSEN